MKTTVPVCPILSIRSSGVDELCLGEECALYLSSVKKCSLVYMGLNALMNIQLHQQEIRAAGGQLPKS